MDETTGGNPVTAQADAGGASPAPPTQVSAADAAPAAQGTQSPGITDPTDGERSPYIPRARFDEVNNQLKQWREQYGWAESVPREQLEDMAQWYGRYQGDPAEFLEYAYREALNHPVHGESVKSRVGKLLASLRAQPEPSFDPDVPVMNEQGQIVQRTYSADMVKQLIAHEVSKALTPYQQDLAVRQTAEQRAQARSYYEQVADADIAYVQARPFFQEHRAAILQTFKEHPAMTLREAADYVLDHTVLPSYGQKAHAQVVSDFQQKANAQTVNPGTPSGTARPRFKSFADAHAYYELHPEEAAAMANR